MSSPKSGTQQAGSPRAAAGRWLVRATLEPHAAVVVALVLVCVFLTATQPVFFTWANFRSIIGANTVILILAVGETFVIISGGIDLSAASATTATGMILGLALVHGWVLATALVATLAGGSRNRPGERRVDHALSHPLLSCHPRRALHLAKRRPQPRQRPDRRCLWNVQLSTTRRARQ